MNASTPSVPPSDADLPPLARGLASTLRAENPHVFAMLSSRGRRIFFPFEGILGQSAEARGKRINATIGIALEEDGSPLRLPSLEAQTSLPAAEVFPYAPSFGKPGIRAAWQKQIQAKNPSLDGAPISLPVVTVALTHALNMAGYLFLDAGDELLCPDLFWGNYRLIFEHPFGAKIRTYRTFEPETGGFDVAGLRRTLLEGPARKRVVLLNFPNNPTGYTPTHAEGRALVEALTASAEAGNDLVVLIDDAYFGLVYEDGVMTESIFADLARASDRLLAVKIDGPTKEDYVWGLRVGFVTYGVRGGTPALYEALEAKTAGAVRGNVSNAANLSQSMLTRAWGSPAYEAEKRSKFEVLRGRHQRVKALLAAHPEYAERFRPLPFNSGYFMCVKPLRADPEAVRQRLLAHYDTGVIATQGLIRLAFSAVPTAHLDDLFAAVYAACGDVAG